VMLSQIEKGEANPTVNTVWKIAGGLNIPYSALFEQTQGKIEVVTRAKTVAQSDDGGNYNIYCYFASTPSRSFEWFQTEIEAGCSHTSMGHPAKSKEYVMVLQGRLEITVEGRQYLLNKDDAIEFTADNEHIYKNTGAQKAVALVMNYYL
jgi:XRE family transcriptional regulator, regulator of sulfur utilization